MGSDDENMTAEEIDAATAEEFDPEIESLIASGQEQFLAEVDADYEKAFGPLLRTFRAKDHSGAELRESIVCENFTGVDAHGHHWVDGKQVASPDDPADDKKKSDSLATTAEHHKLVSVWIAQSKIPEHLQEKYTADTVTVLDRMSPGCRKAALASIADGGAVRFHATLADLKAEGERVTGQKVNGQILGFVVTSATRPGSYVNLDGGGDTGFAKDVTWQVCCRRLFPQCGRQIQPHLVGVRGEAFHGRRHFA